MVDTIERYAIERRDIEERDIEPRGIEPDDIVLDDVGPDASCRTIDDVPPLDDPSLGGPGWDNAAGGYRSIARRWREEAARETAFGEDAADDALLLRLRQPDPRVLMDRLREHMAPSPPVVPQMAPGGDAVDDGAPLEAPSKQRRPRGGERPFAGDIAIKRLRHMLARDPRAVPVPPVCERAKGPPVPWLGLAACAAMPVLSVGLAAMILSPSSGGPLPSLQTEAQAAVASPPPITIVRRQPPPPPGPAVAPPRLTIEKQRGVVNEPLSLGIALAGGAGGETIVVNGFTAGTQLTGGQQLGLTNWEIARDDIGKVLAQAPSDFVGVMDAAVDLRGADGRLVDSQLVQLEWVPKPSSTKPPSAKPPAESQSAQPVAPQAKAEPQPKTEARVKQEQQWPEVPAKVASQEQLPADELDSLVKRGRGLLKIGDVASARLVLRRAALGGSGEAAYVLGSSYDPDVLADLGVLGFPAEIDQARMWYQRALELGSHEASRRIARLARAM